MEVGPETETETEAEAEVEVESEMDAETEVEAETVQGFQDDENMGDQVSSNFWGKDIPLMVHVVGCLNMEET
jgi:hypothetical protein